ncbi:hypothetical protein [Microcoleus sp. AT9b-C5]|uniref:hypothetical protein n=1 Tax=unclassified Microcoleus TaxID=2642155 RepID=UPI002FCEC147
MDLHIYTRELLEKHLLPELKEIASGLGIIPPGNKTCRETWIIALVGQPFPVFQSIAIQAQEPIENSPGAVQAQEPIENSPGVDRETEPKLSRQNSPGVDRVQEPIEFPDLQSALAEINRLRTENEELLARVRSQTETIHAAKDITPVQKCSFIRVLKLARAACLDLSKSITGGWVLSLGTLQRTFKSLHEIWRLLVVGEWSLSDLFEVQEKEPTPSPDAFSHNRVFDWFSALGKVGLPEPLEAAQSKRWGGRFAAIPFCDDGLIDTWALGVESSGRSPPVGGDVML